MLTALLSGHKEALFLCCAVGAATACVSTSKEIPQDRPGPWVSKMLTHVGSFWVSVNLLKYDLQENAEIIKVPVHYILAESNAVTMAWKPDNCVLVLLVNK